MAEIGRKFLFNFAQILQSHNHLLLTVLLPILPSQPCTLSTTIPQNECLTESTHIGMCYLKLHVTFNVINEPDIFFTNLIVNNE